MLAGCSGSSDKSKDPAKELLVASASDMANALPDLAQDFQKRTGIKVTPSFGPSGGLVHQIVNGAPFDLFLSADQKFLSELVESKHVDGDSRRVYAIGTLALYSPKMRVLNMEDLRRPEIRRIAIANPELAPYGRAAKQALERANVWDIVKDKVVMAENIRQSLQMADSGNVEVSFTALSLVSGPSSASTEKLPETILKIPQNLYDQIQQEAGVVSRSPTKAQAKAFLDYMKTAEGKAILQRYGFAFPN